MSAVQQRWARDNTHNQDFVDVVADVEVGECRVKNLEIGVVHVLKDEAGRFGVRVPHYVQELNHVRAAGQVLQDLDLPEDGRAK